MLLERVNRGKYKSGALGIDIVKWERVKED